VIKKIIFLSLVLSIFYTNAKSIEINSKFNIIKSDYLISYYINTENDINKYEITPSIFYHKGFIYNITWQDFITNYRPIDAYNYHKISLNNFINTIQYFYNLSQSKPKLGSYTKNPIDYLIIEGRYKNKPFLIKISDPGNRYISENVTKDNLSNRENIIKKLYQHYNVNKAVLFKPQSYIVLYKIADINEDTSDIYPKLDIDINPGCYIEKFLVSDYNGIYNIKSTNKNIYYYITSKPNLTGINLCEK
jgi:hypothetical protein